MIMAIFNKYKNTFNIFINSFNKKILDLLGLINKGLYYIMLKNS